MLGSVQFYTLGRMLLKDLNLVKPVIAAYYYPDIVD